MAKFLNTTSVSYHLEQIIKSTKQRLLIISPYLQFSEIIRGLLETLNNQKRSVLIIYRENKLHKDEASWLDKQKGIRKFLCNNLHSKCYINESEAIITSMNLYEFSQKNNYEMGIHITRSEDATLFNDAMTEAELLLKLSQENRPSNTKISSSIYDKPVTKVFTSPFLSYSTKELPFGYCIRTGIRIPFDVDRPLSKEAYKIWNEFADSDYPEQYCHFSGERSNGDTSVYRPVLKKNWKKAREMYDLQ